MTYLEFINKIRTELSDFGKIHTETFDGDASTLNFAANYIPIKDSSYTVKIGGAEQTETTHYAFNRDTGILTFVSAPTAGSDNVEIAYQSVKIRDEDYLEIINDAIDHFRWKFWKMDIDTTTLTTTKDQYEYDCSSITEILYVLRAYYKTASSATVWQEIAGLTNYKYYTRLQKLYVDPTFGTTSLPMKLIYLKSFAKGTATTDTLDIPDEFILPYKYYIYARYYELLIAEKIHETAAVTTQPTYAPAQLVFDIASKFYNKAEDVANKIAPKLPPMPIKQLLEGAVL